MKKANVIISIMVIFIAGYMLTSCSGKGKSNSSSDTKGAAKNVADSLKNISDAAVPKVLVVTGSSVNMRVLPSVKAVRIKQLRINDTCAILEKGKQDTIGGDVDIWYKIKYKTKEGWVFGEYTNLKLQVQKQDKPKIFFQKKK